MLTKRRGSAEITPLNVDKKRVRPPLNRFVSEPASSVPGPYMVPLETGALARPSTFPEFDVEDPSPAASHRSLPVNLRAHGDGQAALGIIQESDGSSRVASTYRDDSDNSSISDADTVVHVGHSEGDKSWDATQSIPESHPASLLFRSQPSVTSLAHLSSNMDSASSRTSTISKMSLNSVIHGFGVHNPIFRGDDGELELEYRVKDKTSEEEEPPEQNGFEDVELENKTFTAAYTREEQSEEETENLLNTARDEEGLEQLEWDVFREIIPDGEKKMFENFFRIGTKALKVLFIVIAFLTILGSLVVSKVGLLYATSNMNKYVGFRKHGGDRKYDYERRFNDSCGAPVCYEPTPSHPVDFKEREMVRWIWCVMLCLCIPYLLTFLQCTFKIMFKRKKKPKKRAFVFVTIVEMLHSAGIFCLLFVVLPNLDLMRGIFLMNATLALPSFLKLLVRPKNHNDTIDVQDNGGFVVMDLIAFLCQMSAPILWVAMSIDKFSSSCGYESCNCQNISIHSVCQHLQVATLSYLYPPNSGIHSYPEIAEDNSSLVTMRPTTVVPPMFHSVNVTQIGPLPECLSDPNVYLIPVGLILVSLSHWENFVDDNLRLGSLAKALRSIREEVKTGRTKIYSVVSFLKIVLTFGLLFAFMAMDPYDSSKTTAAERIKLLFNRTSFQSHEYANNQYTDIDGDWLAVFGFAAAGAMLCYFATVLSIQANVQRSTFSLATTLATPISIAFALWICTDCRGSWDLSKSIGINVELYWNCHGGYETLDAMIQHRYITLLGLAWWVGQMLLVRYIWSPHSERLAKPKRIFVQPLYCGIFLEQSLTLNRCRDDLEDQPESKLPPYVDMTNEKESDDVPYELETELRYCMEPLYERQDLSKPMLFVCVTMWHEREAEMIPLLKSILRLDKDQCARRLTRDYFRVRVPDYYDFEVHIFFDDAFEKHALDINDFKVGPFVETFMSAILVAARSVHGLNVEIEDPVKQVTPYGGKLIYTLPGGNTVTVHMKDIVKIRHRKRWSQVMYLYYLLGYRLWGTNAVKNTKELIANNTFILTLDGDIDFQPDSVLHLVDLMKRDIKVGAACGRIHPKGSGPMVWYQQFEYAISHWLQKSAEHILGCVLCSPGCFSLFRASALMDDNVMKKYSNRAQEAVQYVQYDQGEDRWLCTLLLQQGYKVEYSAAADAVTFAPEGFNEFFNQRRRWTPSTFANILDLLTNGMSTVRKNENINVLYIFYQWGLFASSVLGPGTIVLMIAGAFETALGMTALGAFFLVMTPLFVFFLLAFFAKPNIQLGFAAVLSALFCVAQIVVLVGIILEITEEGICSPTSMFMIFIVGVFFISALLHPMEFANILHGMVYYLAIPTMYLILIIYSLVNLNIVSWGTREVTKTKTEEEQEMKKKMENKVEEAKKSKNTFGLASFFGGLASLGGLGGPDVDGWTWSCGHCCRMMCCPRPGQSSTDARITGLSVQTSALHNELATLRQTIQTLQSILPSTSITQDGAIKVDDIEVKAKIHNPDTYIRDSDSENEDEMDKLLDAAIKPLEMMNIQQSALPPPPMFPQTTPLESTYMPGGIPVQSYPRMPVGFEHLGSAPVSPTQAPDLQGVAPPAQKQVSVVETPMHEGAAVKPGPPPEVVRSTSVFPPLKTDDPPWALEPSLGTGKIKLLNRKEKTFWEDLIARYLYPLIHDKVHQEKVARHLRELRNKAVIGFFMVDVLFIVLMQSIQLANDNVASDVSGGIMIRWNCSDPVTGTIRPQLLEPTGIAFILVFGMFLAVQFVAMLFHRLFSLVQIVSTTTLFPKKDQRTANVADMVNLTKDMAKLEEQSIDSSMMGDTDAGDKSDSEEEQRDRAHTIMSNMGTGGTHGHVVNRIQKSMRKNTFKTMENAFMRNLLALGEISKGTPHATLQGGQHGQHHDREGLEGGVARRVSNAKHEWMNTSNAEFLQNIQLKNNKARPAIPMEMKMRNAARNPSSASQMRAPRDRVNSSMSRANKGTFGGHKGTYGGHKGTFGGHKGTFGKHDKALVNVIKRRSTIFDEAKAKSIRAKHNLTLRDVQQAKREMAKIVNIPVAVLPDSFLNEEEESTVL